MSTSATLGRGSHLSGTWACTKRAGAWVCTHKLLNERTPVQRKDRRLSQWSKDRHTDAKTEVDRQHADYRWTDMKDGADRRTNNGRKDVRQTSRNLAVPKINTLTVFVSWWWICGCNSLLCYTKGVIFYRVACGWCRCVMQHSVLQAPMHSALGATQPRHSALTCATALQEAVLVLPGPYRMAR
jgi:hypothetical protein